MNNITPNSEPTVSILMCVYNAEKYLKDSLDSISNLTYKNKELVLVNDGSTDLSFNIIDDFIKKNVVKVVYIEHENIGLTRSLNIAIDNSSGDYIMRFDADDLSSPNRIEKSLNYLIKNSYDLICTQAIQFQDDKFFKCVPSKRFSKNLLNKSILKYGNPVIHGTFFGTRKTFKKFKYNERYRTSQDYELLCRLSNSKNVKIGLLKEVLYQYRLEDNSVGRAPGSKQKIDAMNICSEIFGTDFYFIFGSGLLKRNFLRMTKLFEYLCLNLKVQ